MSYKQIDEQFDEEFTYFEEGGQYILGGYDEKTRLNTDCIPEIKQFIHQICDQATAKVREEISNKLNDIWKLSMALYPYSDEDISKANYEKLKKVNQSVAKLIDLLQKESK